MKLLRSGMRSGSRLKVRGSAHCTRASGFVPTERWHLLALRHRFPYDEPEFRLIRFSEFFSRFPAIVSMKEIFVADLVANQLITTTFLVKSKDVKAKRTGAPYLSLTLGDKSGELDAKMWDNVEEVDPKFERDDFVKVKGSVQVYRNRPQLTIHKLRRCQDGEIDFADYFPKTTKDVEVMYEELLRIVDGIETSYLRELLISLLMDEEFAARFKQAPAAKSLHHAWIGGLLEHTLSLCKLCKLVAQNYEGIDVDLLLTGAVLHDVGKTQELNYTRSFSYTTEGQLLGHMILELDLVNEKIAQMEAFPRELKTLVQHLIISHHGEHEFGSPKKPMFPEALLLHCLDNLDSKLEAMKAILRTDPNIEGDWTGYNAMFGRPLFKGFKRNGQDPPKND
jgi:3'-5' exoribonuclease